MWCHRICAIHPQETAIGFSKTSRLHSMTDNLWAISSLSSSLGGQPHTLICLVETKETLSWSGTTNRSALEERRLSPWQLMQWTLGGVLADVEAPAVAPFFDALLDHSNSGYAVAANDPNARDSQQRYGVAVGNLPALPVCGRRTSR